jgi:hypothetical protein
VTVTSSIPPPVGFSIDAAQSARLRKVAFASGSERALLFGSAAALLVTMFNYAVQARVRGWQDPLAFGPALMYVAAFASMAKGTFERCTVRPAPATTVTFDETGLSIERIGTTQAARIPFARIRSVRLTPDIVAVYGIWTTYVTIPTSALPDGGILLLGFLRDRIVSKGMLDNSSHGVTTIFNSVSPVLARR